LLFRTAAPGSAGGSFNGFAGGMSAVAVLDNAKAVDVFDHLEQYKYVFELT
jgi:hypothetical protein